MLEIRDFSNNVAILQLQDLSDESRIKTYAKSLNEGSIILLGEYVIDPFFSQNWEELNTLDSKAKKGRSKNIESKEDSKQKYLKDIESKLKNKKKIDLLVDISKAHKHIIIAPYIEYKNEAKFKGYYKNILILHNEKMHIYTQQRLIQYEHWNEARFFANDINKLPKMPLTFSANGIKFGVLFGFEAHFDEFWMDFKKAGVDVVLVPTASTFSSNDRWLHLLNTHSFTNSCYVFRANRIGKVMASDGYEWDFYGHSFVCLGQDVIDSLDESEGMLSVELDINALNVLKNEWKFR